MSFQEFLLKNKEKILKIASENATYDSEGKVILSKNDEWREHEDDLNLVQTKFIEFISNN